MIVASHFIINTLRRGVLRGEETQNHFNFNGFYARSKTAEAVRTPPLPSYTPLKQGVNEKHPILRYRRWHGTSDSKARFAKHSGSGFEI